MRYAAVDLNFDSLGEAYGFPAGYKDPSFFEIADRFLALAQKYNFKYSIYVIGKDLEKPENRERVKEWSRQGHEIGNHSWSHHMDLGALSRDEIYQEVKRAHDSITETIGDEPKGFISPAWTNSRTLYDILNKLGYHYDTSAFPSWIMFPAMVKNLVNYFGNAKLPRIFHRRDFGTLIWGAREVHRRGSVIVLPLPANRFRVACWHTLGFTLGWKLHQKLLHSCLRDVDGFYYLIHPADLMDKNDIDSACSIPLERLNISLDQKIRHLEQAIKTILESGRKIVTMNELAQRMALNSRGV